MDIRNLLLATAALVAGLPAQEQDPNRDPTSREKPQAAAPAPKKSVAQLIEALGSDSYRGRLDAERQLRELGTAAAPELKKAAEHSDDAEVQWRARRVLRLIEQGGTELEAKKQGDAQAPGDATQERRTRAGARRLGGSDPMRDQFESLFERLNRDFGVDVPRARFFDDNFFRDLQEQMKDGMSHSQGMSMQVGPDGAVHVEVQEKGADGKVDKKVYDAPDMESFQKQYPGVLRQSGLGFGFPGGLQQRWFSTQPLRGFNFDGNDSQPWTTTPLTPATPGLPELRDADVPASEPVAPPPAGKRLGISIKSEIPAELREYLDLDEGVGLMVDTVSDGSLAQALGLQKGDVVTKVGARSIRSSKDVQEALAPIKKGSPVEVQIVRKGALQTLKADKTEDIEDAKAEKTESTDKPKLQRRKKAEGGIR